MRSGWRPRIGLRKSSIFFSLSLLCLLNLGYIIGGEREIEDGRLRAIAFIPSIPDHVIQPYICRYMKRWLVNGFSLLPIFATQPIAAQIVPDATLPVNSTVTPEGNTRIIDGGTRAGNNLFHSFQEFSVPTGGTAFFNNALDIQHIFSRVTGGSISNIDGLIRANGTANLFLINPNGIIFGRNARLNIGGSFLASTADSVVFADGSFFSAKNPQGTPLLTISVPVGLQYGGVGGNIVNQASVTNSDNFGSGLQVQLGNTLTLVGGDVRLEGGILQAPGGRIELGGLAAPGIIGLSIDGNNLRLNFPEGVARSNVFLSNQAVVRVDAGGGGNIAINARNLEMSARSSLIAGVRILLGSSDDVAGDIDINTTDKVTMSSSAIATLVGTAATGQGGDVNITTRSFFATNTSVLSSSTFGFGNAGNLNITATDTVVFDGQIGDGLSTVASSTVEKGAVGNAGNINITTRSLSVTGGAQLQVLTRGQGNAGNLRITATDSVFFDGVSSNRSPSSAFSTVESGAVGNGGSIDITTRSLSITNGGVLTARTNGEGNAGNININNREIVSLDGVGIDEGSSGIFSTVGSEGVGKGGEISITTGSLAVTNGAQLLVGTQGKGDAGNVRIIATDSVSFDGVGSNEQSSGIFSTVAAETAIGKGGLIEIETGLLSVTNRAVLNANSLGKGAAGNIEIKADSVGVDQASIGAETVAGQGNITVRSHSLILRNRSFITTNATGSNIVGGNITLDVGVLAALANSDISANSEEFVGGNVNIDTQGIFGTQARDALTKESDITATGAIAAGTIAIAIPDVDPSSGLVELPDNVVDITRLIADRCLPARKGSSFIVTGRGGIAPSPNESMGGETLLVDLVTLDSKIEGRSDAEIDNNTETKIVEATGWVIDEKGQVVLVASAPTADQVLLADPACRSDR